MDSVDGCVPKRKPEDFLFLALGMGDGCRPQFMSVRTNIHQV